MDLAERISQAASAQDILAYALSDAVARGMHAFTDEPTDAQIQQWASSLRDVAPHFFPQASPAPGTEGVPVGMVPEVWRSMHPSARLAWAREHGLGAKPVERRPKPVTLTSEQVSQLAALPPAQRLAAYRALQEQAKV
jgi:hypothetical protein